MHSVDWDLVLPVTVIFVPHVHLAVPVNSGDDYTIDRPACTLKFALCFCTDERPIVSLENLKIQEKITGTSKCETQQLQI